MLLLALCQHVAAQNAYMETIQRMQKFYRDNLNCTVHCNTAFKDDADCAPNEVPPNCACRAIETMLNFHEQYLVLEFAACELRKTKLMMKEMEDIILGLHELMTSSYFARDPPCYCKENVLRGIGILERELNDMKND